MQSNKAILLCVFVALYVTMPATAQFRLPQVDVDLKGAFSLFDAGSNENIDNMNATSIQGGVHVQINQHIAIGAYYMKSFSGQVGHKNGNNETATKNDMKLM